MREREQQICDRSEAVVGEVSDAIRRVDEHGACPGADPLQPSHHCHPPESARTTEGHQGTGRHVSSARERL